MLVPLIEEIRDFLHDSDGDRWTDEKILTQINRAQQDLVNRTRVLKETHGLGLRDNIDLIQLPSDLLGITEVKLNNCTIKGKTHDELDRLSCSCRWETQRGTPLYYILDKTNRQQLRLYPIPNVGTDTRYQKTGFGLFANIGNDTHGVITDVANLHTEIIGHGTTTDILLDNLTLQIHYDKKPKLIDSIHNELEVDGTYEIAIKHYVCGHLLRNDRDSESRSLGNEELKLYSNEVKLLKKDVSKGFTNGTDYSIGYRRF